MELKIITGDGLVFTKTDLVNLIKENLKKASFFFPIIFGLPLIVFLLLTIFLDFWFVIGVFCFGVGFSLLFSVFLESNKRQKKILNNITADELEIKVCECNEKKKYQEEHPEDGPYTVYKIHLTHAGYFKISRNDFVRICEGDKIAVLYWQKDCMKLAVSLKYCKIKDTDISLE